MFLAQWKKSEVQHEIGVKTLTAITTCFTAKIVDLSRNITSSNKTASTAGAPNLGPFMITPTFLRHVITGVFTTSLYTKIGRILIYAFYRQKLYMKIS